MWAADNIPGSVAGTSWGVVDSPVAADNTATAGWAGSDQHSGPGAVDGKPESDDGTTGEVGAAVQARSDLDRPIVAAGPVPGDTGWTTGWTITPWQVDMTDRTSFRFGSIRETGPGGPFFALSDLICIHTHKKS